VTIPHILEPFEAQTLVLLGAKLATTLNLQDATLYTDNQVLAMVVRASSLRTHLDH
jgi:hypothetical protein